MPRISFQTEDKAFITALFDAAEIANVVPSVDYPELLGDDVLIGATAVPAGCHMIVDDRDVARLARMDQAEYDNWRNQTTTVVYADLKIVPKKDFGPHGYYDSKLRGNIREGWLVVYTQGKYKGCDAMPGGTWSPTHEGAMRLIHAFLAAGGDTNSDNALTENGLAQRFHALLQLTKKDD